jgi:glycosyltransferase involved in cell wall biosynthesis
MTRVLHVQKVSGISGSEAHLLSLLPGLRGAGFDAEMLVLHEGEPGARAFVEAMRANGVPVTALRMRFDVDPLVFARLVRRRDIVHTHLVHADVLGLPAAALARVPVRVSTKHGFNEFRANRVVAAADRAAARLAHRQIAISEGLARYLSETQGYAEDAFTVVHYGIDAGPEPPPPPPPAPRLVAVGRLISIKGFDVLLQAFARARADVPDLTLEVAGAGPLEAELRVAAPDGVTLLGRVAPIAEVYERNAIAVVPSRGEGFGMVALEAAERGRAAIVSDVGGLPEIVEHERTGLVVPPEDAGALAAAIVALARDPERIAAFGVEARRRALAQFTSSAATEGVARVYREELAKRSTAAAASSTSRKSNGTR